MNKNNRKEEEIDFESKTMDYYGIELPKKIALFLHNLNAYFIIKHLWDPNERLREGKIGEERENSCGYIIEDGEIVYLSLYNSHIWDIEEIPELYTLTQLKHLCLNHNNISKIKGLEKLIKLEKLWLTYNDISEIKGLDTLTNLVELNISHNQIKEKKGLDHLLKLRNLDIHYNPLNNYLVKLPECFWCRHEKK